MISNLPESSGEAKHPTAEEQRQLNAMNAFIEEVTKAAVKTYDGTEPVLYLGHASQKVIRGAQVMAREANLPANVMRMMVLQTIASIALTLSDMCGKNAFTFGAPKVMMEESVLKNQEGA